MAEAVLGLGGNLGARRAIFRAAIALLDAQPGCRVLSRSKLYETPALGPPQPDYLNAAVRVHFDGEVGALLAMAQRIELRLGRERRVRWGARTLDIDVLHWSEGTVQSEGLEVPHRELSARTFALAPLLDVAPELAASLGQTLADLGGPPPLASPEWPKLQREAGFVCGSWLRDELELASQLVELLATRAELVERAEQALARKAPLASHAFTGPRELFDADGRSWLTAAVGDALGRGFVVQMGALLACDETHCSGILLGYEGGTPSALTAPTVALEARGGGGERISEALAAAREQKLEWQDEHVLRVKMPQDMPEHGFDFNGSGTM